MEERRRPELADTVVVTLSGDPARHDFAALARAAAAGARAVKPDGNVIILSEADPELSGAADVLAPDATSRRKRSRCCSASSPPTRPRPSSGHGPPGRAKLYLASEIRPTTVEEMFATPLSGPKDVQRLLDAPGRILIIPDAHKSWVTVT